MHRHRSRAPSRSRPLSRAVTRPIAALVVLTTLLAACGSTGPLPSGGSSQPTLGEVRQLTVSVLEKGTNSPVSGATVSTGDANVMTNADGTAQLTAARGAELAAQAPGHDQSTGTVPDSGDVQLTLRSNVVNGTVTQTDGKPVSGVRVFVDGQQAWVRSDQRGRYSLAGVPEQGTMIFKLAGYRLGELKLTGQPTADFTLQPFETRALYAPGAVFEGAGRLDALLRLIDRTEVNSMVIDVKETGGWLYYTTNLPEAKESGADRHPIFELNKLLPKLKARGIYTIARMVVMKDNTVGESRPELAVRNAATGKPWKDNGGGIWLDPFNPGVAEYIAAIAGDLADKGFDEVQLDYVRFFSDGDYSVADTNLPNTQSFRLPAIRRLLRVVSTRLATTHTFLSADCFPISFIAPDDQGIGQRPEVIMPYVDYFSPMVYPSHYGPGTFGYAVPNEHPFAIINDTLKMVNKEAAGLPMRVRPWIQDFGYGPFRAYTATDIREEMRALRENHTVGWMIWNAQAIFTESALGAPRDGEDSGITRVGF
ncbi:MAG TPA: putative glycoside hydrolase [Candidatus Limnocylindria bacterium]|nr:putative glycoside hydrolase [Candidatus Limnocylindria bacterium]